MVLFLIETLGAQTVAYIISVGSHRVTQVYSANYKVGIAVIIGCSDSENIPLSQNILGYYDITHKKTVAMNRP